MHTVQYGQQMDIVTSGLRHGNVRGHVSIAVSTTVDILWEIMMSLIFWIIATFTNVSSRRADGLDGEEQNKVCKSVQLNLVMEQT